MGALAIALGEIATNVENLKLQSYLHQRVESWTNAYLDDIEQLQILSLAADDDATAYLAATRGFIINNEAFDVDLEMGGTVFTFTAGDIYCTSPAEAAFFIQEAEFLGFDITASNSVDFAAGGTVAVFFE